ncbi:hypothetical protein HY384_03200 [Candidatus Daviesbacteria bacterium]|nr:hypothetical protein [Candidatus Daviesbacteria bacterium]
MILWLLLFLLIIAISFFLALGSMRDYPQNPDQSIDYSLFLIRQTNHFNQQNLELICQDASREKAIISLERLFKGGESASVVFGPKKILADYEEKLGLLELEDYVESLDQEKILASEVDMKNPTKINLPKLERNEQVWCQVVIGPEFKTQIRICVYASDPIRRKQIFQALLDLSSGQIIKLPVPYSSNQLLIFYQLRSLGMTKNRQKPKLNEAAILELIKV